MVHGGATRSGAAGASAARHAATLHAAAPPRVPFARAVQRATLHRHVVVGRACAKLASSSIAPSARARMRVSGEVHVAHSAAAAAAGAGCMLRVACCTVSAAALLQVVRRMSHVASCMLHAAMLHVAACCTMSAAACHMVCVAYCMGMSGKAHAAAAAT
jgi:hypothetical protein